MFVQWMQEGQHDCDVARSLGVAWARDLSGSGNATLADFFNTLLHEHENDLADNDAEGDGSTENAADAPKSLPIPWLAGFIYDVCTPLSFEVKTSDDEDALDVLATKIAEELQAVQAYARALHSSAVMPAAPPENIHEATRAQIQETVHPWPTIHEKPVPELADGRFAKAFPLKFPMGVEILASHVCVPIIRSSTQCSTCSVIERGIS